MDRLNLFILLAAGGAIPGALVIIVLSAGYYAWPPIVAATVIGCLIAIPTCYWISRRIKRKDPDWNTRRNPDPGPMPRPGTPEL
jgi:putative flippase GtrA